MSFKKSSLAIVAVMLIASAIDLDLRLWEQQRRVIEHDVHGYYGFLPALFIYDDIRLEKSDYLADENYHWFWPDLTSDGRRFIKYPVGLAVMYAPFFFVAHGLAPLLGAPADGFSPPYKVMLLVAGLVYLLGTLLILRAVLRRLGYGELPIAITLLLLGAGTNAMAYATQSGTMPHIHGLFLVTVFIWFTLRWYERITWGRTLALGFTLGLITLVRPNNGVVVLFFLLYGVVGWKDLRGRAQLFLKHLPHLVVMALLIPLTWTPQFLYWWTVMGTPVYYSYQEEGFFFLQPQLLKGLFGFQKGWLVYAPVMAFALVGLLMLRGAARALRTGIVTVLVVHVYITLSWWCWWYGGSFGQRALIETYSLLAVPLCAFVERASAWTWPIKVPLLLLGGFLIWLNVFQTYQYEVGSLHHDATTPELYWKQFGRMERVDGFYDMLDHIDAEKARRGER